jgi:predicted TPR repeat methyltransferase
MSKEKLNIYGDTLVENSGKGSDISTQRLDSLDKHCIDTALGYVEKQNRLTLVDLGCGRCGFINQLHSVVSKKHPGADLSLTAVDIQDYRSFCSAGVNFRVSDMISYLVDYAFMNFHIIYSQRTIHYLNYQEATHFLEAAYNALRESGGWLYLSASGLHSELGDGYAHASMSLSERFEFLSPVMQKRHGIKEKVCLYTPDELAKLVGSVGFVVGRTEASEFGNVKLIAMRV